MASEVPDAPPTGPLSGPRGRLVRRRRQTMIEVAAAYGVTHLRVFGSVSRGTEHAASDVDLLVDLPSDLGLVGLGRLQAALEDILDGTPVDLVPASGLKPEVRRRADREAVPLWSTRRRIQELQ